MHPNHTRQNVEPSVFVREIPANLLNVRRVMSAPDDYGYGRRGGYGSGGYGSGGYGSRGGYGGYGRSSGTSYRTTWRR